MRSFFFCANFPPPSYVSVFLCVLPFFPPYVLKSISFSDGFANRCRTFFLVFHTGFFHTSFLFFLFSPRPLITLIDSTSWIPCFYTLSPINGHLLFAPTPALPLLRNVSMAVCWLYAFPRCRPFFLALSPFFFAFFFFFGHGPPFRPPGVPVGAFPMLPSAHCVCSPN